MISALLAAKQALVLVLRALALTYGVAVDINRDSSDQSVAAAFRNVARKAHPDKGGRRSSASKPRQADHLSLLLLGRLACRALVV